MGNRVPKCGGEKSIALGKCCIEVVGEINRTEAEILLQLVCLAALVVARPQVLKSQLPTQPIEDPDLWSWGQHPNGLGYKAAHTQPQVARQCGRQGELQ